MIKNIIIIFLLVINTMYSTESKNINKGLNMKENNKHKFDKLEETLKYIEINNKKIPLIFENSNLLPIGFITIIFNGGGYISQNKPSLAYFSANLLERGTKSKGEVEFASLLESNAINLSVDIGIENLKFSIDFLKEKEDKAIKLLGELLVDPNLTDEAFEQTKLNLTSYLLSKNNDFDYIASKNLNKVLFKNTKLENTALDSIESINKISLNDIKQYIKNTFILDNVVIIAGGDINFKNLDKKLEAILNKIPSGKKYISPVINTSYKSDKVISKNNTQQAYIYFGAPFKFDGYENSLHKAQIMSFILGGSGFGSRIMEEVRVKRGLAYSAYFYNVINNITSYYMGYLQTKLENKDEAIKVVKQTIKNFIKNGATKEELDNAKDYILGSKVLKQETISQRLNQKYANFNMGLSLNYDDILIEKIKKLTLEELNEYIKKHDEINNLSISIVQN